MSKIQGELAKFQGREQVTYFIRFPDEICILIFFSPQSRRIQDEEFYTVLEQEIAKVSGGFRYVEELRNLLQNAECRISQAVVDAPSENVQYLEESLETAAEDNFFLG